MGDFSHSLFLIYPIWVSLRVNLCLKSLYFLRLSLRNQNTFLQVGDYSFVLLYTVVPLIKLRSNCLHFLQIL